MKGKKLVIAVILALIVCLVLIPTCAFAETGENVEQTEQAEQNSEKSTEGQNNNPTETGEGTPANKGGDNPGETLGGDEATKQNKDAKVTDDSKTEENKTDVVKEGTSGTDNTQLQPTAPKYTVEFGENKEYVLNGGESAKLSDVLGALGIHGEVSSASSSKDNLFSVAQDADGVWMVSANTAFNSEQNMTVVVDGKTYEIVVTDDNNGYVASIKGDASYSKLQDAINNAGEGATIQLIDNVTECITIPEGKTITIDLGGYTLTNDSRTMENANYRDMYGIDTQPTILNKGNLTIIDSSNGKGTVDHANGYGSPIVNAGIMTINGGTYNRSGENGTYDVTDANTAYTIINLGNMTINDGKVNNDGGHSSTIGNRNVKNKTNPVLTINGGTFTGGKHTVNNDNTGTVYINGGTFTNYSANKGKAGADTVKNEGKMTITGGKFTYDGTNSVVVNTNDGNVGGNMTITGGEFTGTVTNKDGGNVVNVLTVTGGTFTDETVKNYVPTAGYDIAENGSTYVVSKHVDPTPAPVVVPEQTTTTKKDDTLVEAKKENATEQSNVSVEGTTAKITVTDNKGELIAPQEVTIKSVTALESTGATEASIQLDKKLIVDLDVATMKAATAKSETTTDAVTVTNEDSVITVKSGETALVSVDVKAVVSETEQTVTVKFSENTVKVVCGDTAYSIDLSELGDVGTLTLKLENGVLKVYDKDGNLLKEIEKA